VARATTLWERLARLVPPDRHATARAWLRLGQAQRGLGDPAFLGAIEEAGRIGRRVRDADVVVEAATASVWPGSFFVAAGQVSEPLVELCEDALSLIAADDPRRARVLSTLATHLTFDPDRARRVDLLTEALAVARRSDDPELVGTVLVAEYIALWDARTMQRRTAIAAELARLARRTGDGDLEFFAGFFAAFGAAERCDLVDARQRLDALAGPVSASQNFYFAFLVERLAVSLDILQCRPGAAARIDALANRHNGRHADTEGTWALQTGGCAHQQGRLGEFAPALREMVERSDVAANWRAPLALAMLEQGDHAGARDLLADFGVQRIDYMWLTATMILGEVAVGLEDREAASEIFDALWPFRDQLAITGSGALCLGLVGTSLGALAIVLDRPEVAIEVLDAAMARADEAGIPFESVRSRRLLAEILHGEQPHHDVVAFIEDARAVATTHGFAGELRQLERLDAVRHPDWPAQAQT
jgi:hypothetical protein